MNSISGFVLALALFIDLLINPQVGRFLDTDAGPHHFEHYFLLGNVNLKRRMILESESLLRINPVSHQLWQLQVVSVVAASSDELVIVWVGIRPAHGLKSIDEKWFHVFNNFVPDQEVFWDLRVLFGLFTNLLL